MIKHRRVIKTLQRIAQIVFLVLFIFLFVNGKVQLWMGLLLLGIVAAFFASRIYCGWLCPINTVMNGISWIKKKLHLKSLKISPYLTKLWLRFLILGLFIAVFIFIMATGKKLPVLPAFFAIGVLLTIFFPEELWHRYLCPYGTVMNLPASKARYSMSINEDKCNNCGICKRVCPAKAVEKNDKHYEIIKGDCLVCMDCLLACQQDAISYKQCAELKKQSAKVPAAP